MPLTPFHLGPAFLIGIIFHRQINLASILLASTTIDIRAVYCFFFSDCHLHGPLHTYLGATVFAIIIIIIIYAGKNKLKKISNKFKLEQSYSLKSIIIGAFIGTWSHVFLDSFMHFDITPFWPIVDNPFYKIINNDLNYEITIACFVLGTIAYFYKILKHKT